MFAHVYCPDLLIQCEHLFRPELKSQPLIVYESITHQGSELIKLLACSPQARELGFKMGLGSEQLGQLIKQHSSTQESQTLVKCLPNRELYADLSKRLFSSLEMLAPSVTPVAGDEAYLDLTNLKRLTHSSQKVKGSPEDLDLETGKQQLQDFTYELRNSIEQWLGLEILIGVGATKTLAYLGCMAAEHDCNHRPINPSYGKRDEHRGITILTDSEFSQSVLAKFSTSRIRGIGSKTLNKLSTLGIHNALELSQASSQQIGKRCSVLVEHLAIELAGLTSQLTSERVVENQFDSKQLRTSQTLSDAAKTKRADKLMGYEIQESLANYAKAHLKAHTKGHGKNSIANSLLRVVVAMLLNAHKELIERQLICHEIEIILERTDMHAQGEIFVDNKSISLAEPIETLGPIKTLCRQIFENMVRDKTHYHSIGLTLKCLDQYKAKQVSLFEEAMETEKLLHLDKSDQSFKLIQRYCELHDLSKQRKSPHKQSGLPKSPSYTSQWHELLRVN